MECLIEYPELEVTFELPEKISVNTNLRFWAGWRQAEDAGDFVVIKRWELINRLGLLTKWQCAYFPDPKVDLDEVDNARVADVVVRAVASVFQYMLELRAIEKK
jgi:hypothetical protein